MLLESATTFGGLLAAYPPDSIRLIKVDVEGNEELTVQGMGEYLSGAAGSALVQGSRAFLRPRPQ